MASAERRRDSDNDIVVLNAGGRSIEDLELHVNDCDYCPRYETDETEGVGTLVRFRNLGGIFNFIRLDTGRCFIDFCSLYELMSFTRDGHTVHVSVPNDMYIPPDDRRTFINVDYDGDELEREAVYSYEVLPYGFLVGMDRYLSQLPSKDIMDYAFNKSKLTLDKKARTITLSMEDLVVAVLDYSGIVLKTYPNWALFDIEDIHYAVFQGVAQTWLYSSLNSPHTDDQIVEL